MVKEDPRNDGDGPEAGISFRIWWSSTDTSSKAARVCQVLTCLHPALKSSTLSALNCSGCSSTCVRLCVPLAKAARHWNIQQGSRPKNSFSIYQSCSLVYRTTGKVSCGMVCCSHGYIYSDSQFYTEKYKCSVPTQPDQLDQDLWGGAQAWFGVFLFCLKLTCSEVQPGWRASTI